MKTTTKVINAVSDCYDAFANWARVANSIPVEAKYPDVRYRGRRWLIDGQVFQTTADKIVEHFSSCAQQWKHLAAEADRAAISSR